MADLNKPQITPPGWRPRHTLKVDDKPGGGYTVLILYADTEEGTAYEGLRPGADRLAFMRKHHHASTRHVQAGERFLDDHERARTYIISVGSPEDRELERLEGAGRDGEELEEGSKEWEAWVAYFKENAHKVEELKEEEA